MSIFIKNVVNSLITQIILLIISVFTAAVIARTLGPENQGIFAMVILLPTTIVSFTNFGIYRSIIYYMGKSEHSLFNDIIRSVITYSSMISIFSIFIGIIILLLFKDYIVPGVSWEYILIGLLLIPLQIFFLQTITGILYGIQKFNIYNILVIIQSVILLILILFLVIFCNLGVLGALIANIISFSIILLISIIIIKKYIKENFLVINFDYKIFKSLFFFGFKVNLRNIFNFLHYRIGIYMINFYLNPLSVGYYIISVSIVERLWMISQVVSTIFYPKVASMKDGNQKNTFTPIITRNVLLLTLLAAVILFFISKWVILILFTQSFMASLEPLQILLFGVAAISVTRVLDNDFDARGKPMVNAFIALIGVIITIILNIILIPQYGINGAALSTTISYNISLLIKVFIYCKVSDNSIADVLLVKKSDIRIYIHLINMYIIDLQKQIKNVAR